MKSDVKYGISVFCIGFFIVVNENEGELCDRNQQRTGLTI